MKEFKTIDELISVMESRGILVNDQTALHLKKESYYAVVNGYKRPFLDLQAMSSSSDDIYLKSTEFDWIYDLFCFDRDLRALTFKAIVKAEAIIKSTVVYAFCEQHPQTEAYLDRSSYVEPENILTAKGWRGNKRALHQRNISKLMETLNGKIVEDGSHKSFITHYVRKYGSVPLWVLSNDLTFGNISHFYQLQKRSIQNTICKRIDELRGQGARTAPEELLHITSVLVDFRNLCAHDERLYCAKTGKSGDINHSDSFAASRFSSCRGNAQYRDPP
jgi:abortive infection bacteriophage resistance protein